MTDYKNRLPKQNTSGGFPDLTHQLFSNLEFQGGSYYDENGKQITYPTLVFDTVLMQVDLRKNIAKTKITGRNGTVKEYIGMDDYKITIDIDVLSNQNGVYPLEKVDQLMEILSAPVSLKVNSNHLLKFGIYYLVIDRARAPQERGGYSQQVFHIEADSDYPLIIQLGTPNS